LGVADCRTVLKEAGFATLLLGDGTAEPLADPPGAF